MAVSPKNITLPTSPTQPCPCGCAPCEDECCDLECLVRPRYFCGQMLTDQDLTALVRWNQGKLRLSRYRDGWGVVHGLPVTCDAEHAYQVWVGPGYAVSCCGDDIVVCDALPFDLRDACRPDVDPCADLSRLRQPGRGSEIRYIDLYIGYGEKPTDPIPVTGANGCGEHDSCEYTRVQEGARLFYQFANPEITPMDAAADAWHTALDRCGEILDDFREKFHPGREWRIDGEAIQRWFASWITRHPMQQFCYLLDEICEAETEYFTRPEYVIRDLFWLLVDCRNSFLTHHRVTCTEHHGVPLARVAVLARDDTGNRRCDVLEIDAYPPYRRLLAGDDWPAPPGMINAGRVIWHPVTEACRTLSDLGVQNIRIEKFAPTTFKALETWLNRQVFVGCHADGTLPPVTLMTVEHPSMIVSSRRASVERVVGVHQGDDIIGKDDVFPSKEKDDLTVINGIGNKRQDMLNERGIYTFEQLLEVLESLSLEELGKLVNMPMLTEEARARWIEEARERLAARRRRGGG